MDTRTEENRWGGALNVPPHGPSHLCEGFCVVIGPAVLRWNAVPTPLQRRLRDFPIGKRRLPAASGVLCTYRPQCRRRRSLGSFGAVWRGGEHARDSRGKSSASGWPMPFVPFWGKCGTGPVQSCVVSECFGDDSGGDRDTRAVPRVCEGSPAANCRGEHQIGRARPQDALGSGTRVRVERAVEPVDWPSGRGDAILPPKCRCLKAFHCP